MVGLPLAGRFSPFETDPVPKAALPVRFIGVGSYSLDVEVVAYVITSDYEEFLALLQQELVSRYCRQWNMRGRRWPCQCGELRSQRAAQA